MNKIPKEYVLNTLRWKVHAIMNQFYPITSQKKIINNTGEWSQRIFCSKASLRKYSNSKFILRINSPSQ